MLQVMAQAAEKGSPSTFNKRAVAHFSKFAAVYAIVARAMSDVLMSYVSVLQTIPSNYVIIAERLTRHATYVWAGALSFYVRMYVRTSGVARVCAFMHVCMYVRKYDVRIRAYA